ncbi:arylamine N-acetyltransferase family protein [Pseudoalteromonas sp. SSM20]|uniref:arylamine N-acetyltransferase family protein n=1 Tax=Pseudoalteromonas sp. SSM20 TaxID=3139394 RepID=UPI003BA97EB6
MEQLVEKYLTQLNINTSLTGLSLISHIKAQHIAALPFSSSNVILNANLSLDEDALFERLVFNKTGGYCFEHNKVMYVVLKQLGFNVRPLITRVLLDDNEGNGRLHRVTLLEFEGEKYIVDVGFGVMNPRFIVPLKNADIDTISGRYTIKAMANNHYRLEYTPTNAEPITLYRFDLAEFTEMDCNIGHFYSSQFEGAAFVNNLVVSRVMENERVLIRNREVTFFDDALNEQAVYPITSAQQLYSLLIEHCLLDISECDVKKLFTFIAAKSAAK